MIATDQLNTRANAILALLLQAARARRLPCLRA